MKTVPLQLLLILAATQEANSRLLRRHRGYGMMDGDGGMMMGGGGEMMMGQGHGMDESMMQDCQEAMETGGMMGKEKMDESLGECPMSTIHKLLNNRDDITRHFKDTSEGVHTKTYSKSSSNETNTWIRQHVESMMELVRSGHRIRNCDGMFRELFDHAAEMEVLCHDDDESGGVQCKYQANGDCAVGLAQAHARVVSAFIEKGWDEVHQDHSEMVPDACLEANN